MTVNKTFQDTHKIMSPEEMKKVLGGSASTTVYCHCNGVHESKEAEDCTQCRELCGEAGVQNCNEIKAK